MYYMKPEHKLNWVTRHNGITVSYLKLLLRRPYHMPLKKRRRWILLISMQGMSNNSNDNKSTYWSNTYLYITQQTRSCNSTIHNTTFTATWLERRNGPWWKQNLASVKIKPNTWHTFLSYRTHSALSLKPWMKQI